MKHLITDVKALHEETLNNLKNSKAKNTIRAYKSDFKDFGAFCAKNNFKPFPSEPKIITLYLTHLSIKGAKMSTLRRRLVSIGMIHKLKGHYLDTKHPVIIENLMGISRKKGNYQKGKKPILINQLKAIINAIENKKIEKIKKARDKAIILVGFGGGFRRAELVNLDYEDLEFVSEGLKITIRKSKTDQFGEGMIKGIPYFNNENFCPVRALKLWIETAGIKSGKIFKISDKSVALIIKKYAHMAGLDPNRYGGHSLRSGFATSAAESGAEERNIMAMTGHKTTQMVRRYIQEANLFKNNALNKIKI